MTDGKEISPSRLRFRRGMVALGAGILVLHVVVYLVDSYDIVGETLLRRLGNVSTENTFPTWLSAALLATTGILCWAVGRVADRDRGYWNGLAALMAILSVDEVASFHETAAGPIRDLLGVDDWLYYAWVIPAVALVVTAVFVFWRFLFRLPPSLRNQLILAAGLYVGGAVGMEIPGGLLSSADQKDSAITFVVVAIEEFLEMAGAAVAIDALIGTLIARDARFVIRFAQS